MSESRDSYFRRMYGWTESEVDAQSEYQGDVCAICGEQNPARWGGSRRPLVVDHDHTGRASVITGTDVRELLCDRCNKTLGFVRDSVPLLLKMARYLSKHSGADFAERVQVFLSESESVHIVNDQDPKRIPLVP